MRGLAWETSSAVANGRAGAEEFRRVKIVADALGIDTNKVWGS